MSEQPIHVALSAVMDSVRAVHKDSVNSQQGFKFRGVDAVVNAVGPALRRHGVIVTPHVLSSEQTTVEVGRNRTQMGHVRVHVQYTFHGPAGDTIDCSVVAESMDAGDKATPKAMSVAYRTALLQALCLPTDEADPDEQTYQRSDAWQPEPDRVEDPAKVAAMLAMDATGLGTVDAITGLWKTRAGDALMPVEVTSALTAAELHTAGVTGAVTLRAWLVACGEFVKAHGVSVAHAAEYPPGDPDGGSQNGQAELAGVTA